jgi:HK97 family phage major capsid protein
MADTMSRGTEGVALPKEISDEIWSKTIEESAVMQLAARENVPGTGETWQTITGDPEAAWVGEGEEAAVGKHSLGSKVMQVYKLTVIEPFTVEFKNDLPRLYDALAERLPKSIGAKFDGTVFFGAAPGDNFDTLADAAAVDVETDVWKGLVSADTTVALNNSALNGWVVSPRMKALLLNAVDGVGRPLFVPSATGGAAIGSLLGQAVHPSRRAYQAGSPDVIGFAGDWTSAVVGITEDVAISYSDQATLKVGAETVNLWQRDMFALKCTMRVGFAVKDKGDFVRLVGKAS